MNPYAPPRAPEKDDPLQSARRDAAWALVLGIVSLVLCAPVTAPFAIWKAHRALRNGPSALAIVGLVLAGLGLASSAIFWFLAIWQYLSP